MKLTDTQIDDMWWALDDDENHRDFARKLEAALAAPAVADTATHKLVPIEPTLEMQYAAIDTGCCTRPTDTYAAMLAAAPEVIADTAGAKPMSAEQELLAALQLCYDHCRLYHPQVETNNVGETVRSALQNARAALASPAIDTAGVPEGWELVNTERLNVIRSVATQRGWAEITRELDASEKERTGEWKRVDGYAAPAIDAAPKPCTCHPDDNPPIPCARQYALNECRAIDAAGANRNPQETQMNITKEIARKSLCYIEGNLPDGPTDQAEFEQHKALLKALATQEAHSDDGWIDLFAEAMKLKMAAAREKGRSGWQGARPADLSRMLRDHVAKGDPIDVANFCMMLWALKERITAAPSGVVSVMANEQIAGDKLVRPRIDETGLTPQCPAMAMTKEELEALPDWVKNAKPPEAP